MATRKATTADPCIVGEKRHQQLTQADTNLRATRPNFSCFRCLYS